MHKHDTFIRAWLDGQPVQYLAEAGVWVDLVAPEKASKAPHWYADSQYRLKPRTVRYRVWLDKQLRPHIAASLMQADVAEKMHTFRQWATDWSEVTV